MYVVQTSHHIPNAKQIIYSNILFDLLRNNKVDRKKKETLKIKLYIHDYKTLRRIRIETVNRSFK